MISERHLAQGFSAFWQELLPLLTPRFVRLFNEGYVKQVHDHHTFEIEPLPVGIENDHPAIVAEMAFFLAQISHQRSISISDACMSHEICTSAANRAIRLVEEYEGKKPESKVELSEREMTEAIEVAVRYDFLYLEFQKDDQIEFSPRVPGTGFIPSCCGDISIGQTLLEVKTVNRNLSGKDIRQLIIYLALQASTGQRRWPSAGFFNPRRGIMAEFTVDPILFRLSGGKTASQVFDELVAFASTRDVHFESAF